jgi:4-amino-4-deoxy-L-arabinose transferase-like glycosyltransferase
MSIPPTAVSSRRFAIGLGVIVLAAFGIRLWTLRTLPPLDLSVQSDPVYYHVQANFVVDGHGFSDPFLRGDDGGFVAAAVHPPLYTLWLAIPSALGLDTFTAHRVWSCVAGALAVAMIGVLGRAVAGNRAGWIAAAFAALYPPLWSIDGLLWPEGLFTGLVALSMWAAIRSRERPGLRWAAAAGGAVALAALARGEGIGLAPLLVTPMILFRAGRRPGSREWRDLGAAALACLVVLAPWMARNALAFERFVPLSTNSDEVFVYANNPWAYGFEDDGRFLGFWFYPWQNQLRAEIGGEPPGDASERARYWRERGVEYAREHPGRLPVVIAARVGRAWNVYAPFQNARFDQIDGKTLWVSQLSVFVWYAGVALAVPGLVILRRRGVTLVPFAAVGVLLTVTAIYAYGHNRFRTPVDLAVIVLAAVTVDHLIARRSAATPLAPAPVTGASA